jgi:hypothetical protein
MHDSCVPALQSQLIAAPQPRLLVLRAGMSVCHCGKKTSANHAYKSRAATSPRQHHGFFAFLVETHAHMLNNKKLPYMNSHGHM